MKNSPKILFSILTAAICTAAFAADKPICQKTGKNCPMHLNKECKSHNRNHNKFDDFSVFGAANRIRVATPQPPEWQGIGNDHDDNISALDKSAVAAS